MQRYILSQAFTDLVPHATPPVIQLQGEHYHHMHNVMRFRTGSKVYLTDAAGESWVAEITGYTDQTVELRWVQDDITTSELPVRVAVACGLSKGDKLDLIVQKATELGADTILPFTSRYAVVKWDENKGRKKQERYQKIAKEAAEQSHRQRVPNIGEVLSIKQLAELASSYDHCLIAYEEEAKVGEKQEFAKTLSQLELGGSLLLVFGPEGGLAAEEVSKLEESGFRSCSLGPRILRAETAPLYALAAISYHFELLSPRI